MLQTLQESLEISATSYGFKTLQSDFLGPRPTGGQHQASGLEVPWILRCDTCGQHQLDSIGKIHDPSNIQHIYREREVCNVCLHIHNDIHICIIWIYNDLYRLYSWCCRPDAHIPFARASTAGSSSFALTNIHHPQRGYDMKPVTMDWSQPQSPAWTLVKGKLQKFGRAEVYANIVESQALWSCNCQKFGYADICR